MPHPSLTINTSTHYHNPTSARTRTLNKDNQQPALPLRLPLPIPSIDLATKHDTVLRSQHDDTPAHRRPGSQQQFTPDQHAGIVDLRRRRRQTLLLLLELVR